MMRRLASTSIRRLALVIVAAVAAACSDSTGVAPEPTVAAVAGTYTATVLNTTESGTTTDWLSEGASIRLDLALDGTTSGRMFIPGAAEEGGDFDADLTGEWSLDGGEVHLDHEADTFLRDLPFRVRGERLEGSAAFSGTQTQVILVREGA